MLRGRQCAQRVRGVAHELVDAMRAERDAEVLRDDIFELMRLVDDGQVALRNDLAEAALAHRRVGAEQVMVDDHDVAPRRRARACA